MTLAALLAQLPTLDLLSTARTWSDGDFDDYLDHRDGEGFESRWLTSSTRLEEACAPDEAQTGDIDRIREVAFKAAFAKTANGDLAAYVSDDFGLIARDVACGTEDAFARALWDAYRVGRLPR